MDAAPRFRINKPQVVHETFDDEVVIMNLSTGNYYSTDKVGLHIWHSIAQGIAIDKINESVARRFGRPASEIASDLNRFVDELQQERLVVPIHMDETMDPKATTDPSDGGDQFDFEPPVLHKYTDMQDMLLLDPIHEVDESGWPNAGNGTSKK